MFSGATLIPSIKTFLEWQWVSFLTCGAQVDVLSKYAACTLSSQTAFVNLFCLVTDYMIHLHSNQAITLKYPVSK